MQFIGIFLIFQPAQFVQEQNQHRNEDIHWPGGLL